MKDLAYNFWSGKVKLWKSYWLVGEILNAIFLFAIFNIEIYLFQNQNFFNQLPIINFNSFNFISKLLIIFWTIFITVGVWRSAENYKGNLTWIILTLLFLSYRIFSMRLIFFS